MENRFIKFASIFLFIGALSCNNSYEEEPPPERKLTRKDSLDQGILYPAAFVANENKYAIDEIPFGINEKQFNNALPLFLDKHRMDLGKEATTPEEKAKRELEKMRNRINGYPDRINGYYLGNFRIKNVFGYYDSSGLYRLEITGSIINSDANTLDSFLREKYGSAHENESENYSRFTRELEEGNFYEGKSWKVGKKKISICFAKQKGEIVSFLAICLAENDMKARQKRYKETGVW